MPITPSCLLQTRVKGRNGAGPSVRERSPLSPFMLAHGQDAITPQTNDSKGVVVLELAGAERNCMHQLR